MGSELTLWAQMSNFLAQAFAKMRGSVSLEYILEAVDPEESEEEKQDRIQREKNGEPREKITIESILADWKADDEVQAKIKDPVYAYDKSNEFLQELVSDYMVYTRHLRNADEGAQKEIMYKRVRAIEDRLYSVNDKMDAQAANIKSILEALEKLR